MGIFAGIGAFKNGRKNWLKNDEIWLAISHRSLFYQVEFLRFYDDLFLGSVKRIFKLARPPIAVNVPVNGTSEL